MTEPRTDAGEEPLKPHGEKLSGAVGGRRPPEANDNALPDEESLKVQGDKLQAAVDKATGDGG